VSRIPRWLRIALYVLVPVVAVALALPYFLDVDRYRPMITSAIEKETGRKARIEKIRARLIPQVGFVIENFTLGNPAGFPEGNVFSVEAIRGSLAWGPLLFNKEFQLSSIELVNPRISLLDDDRGKNNYDFSAAVTPKAGPAAFRIADIGSIELTGIELTMGQVSSSRKRAPVQLVKVSHLDAELSDIALDVKKLKQWKVDAALDGVQMEVPGLRGAIAFKSGEFKLRDGKAESKYEIQVGSAGSARGTLLVSDIERAVAEFDVKVGVLDVDRLMGAAAPSPAATPPRSGRSELLAKGRVSADKIRFAPYEATGASADVRLYTDRVEVWPISLALYGGSLQLSARLDRRQVPERFSSNIQVRNLDVAQAAAASPDTRGKMTGTAEMDLQVFGSMGAGLMDSLSGSGNFTVVNGRFPGVDMGKAVQNLVKLQRVLSFGQIGGNFGGEVSFSSIAGDLAPGNGRVASRRIHVDSSQATVDMGGSFGFDQTLDYDGTAVLAKSSGGQVENPVDAIGKVFGGVMKQTVGRISLPFAVRGTFQNPKIQPGRGLPGVSTAPTTTQASQTQTTEQQPQKKKSIFDIFRKP